MHRHAQLGSDFKREQKLQEGWNIEFLKRLSHLQCTQVPWLAE